MDFGLSEEQRLLEETLRRFLAETVPIKRVREIAQSDDGFDGDLWSGLCELGVPGVLIGSEHGGSGLGMLDAALIAEALGAAAVPSPFTAWAVMAPVAIAVSGTTEQRARWLPELAAGRARVGVAVSEVVARREGARVAVRREKLTGTALFCLDSGAASHFLVAAHPQSLALVAADAPGVTVEELVTIDRTRRTAELSFDGVTPVEWIGGRRGAGVAVGRMIDAGRIALAADTLGAAERALAMAVDYAGQRKQFDRVIGSFQAVKHMCAEMAAAIEPARSLLWYAAHAFDHVPEESRRMSALAKAHLSEIGTDVVRTATEVYGGIGFTDEGDLHLWFKRAGLNRQLLGGPELLRAQVAKVQGWTEPPSEASEL